MKILIALFLVVSPFFLNEIYACQCGYLNSVWREFDDSSAVFVGKAVKTNFKENLTYEEHLKQQEKDLIYEFEIQISFKGVKNETVKINLGKPDMCESGFEVGETYLIYANGSDEQNLKTGTFCSRIEKLKNAEDQIFFINEKIKGKSEPQLYGSVDFSKKENNAWITNFKPDYKFFIDDGQKKIEVITDKKGVFQIYNLKKGNYNLSFIETDKYKPEIYESTGFRVLESGRTIPYDEEFPYDLSDKQIESFIQEPPKLLGRLKNYSKGVYLEITLK